MKTQQEILDKISQLERDIKEIQELSSIHEFTDEIENYMMLSIRDIKDDIKTLKWVLN